MRNIHQADYTNLAFLVTSAIILFYHLISGQCGQYLYKTNIQQVFYDKFHARILLGHPQVCNKLLLL